MIALGGNNDDGVLMVIALLVGLWSPEIQFPITFPIALRHFYNRDHLRPFHSFLQPNSPFNPLLLLLLCLSPTQTQYWNWALKTNSNVQTITCSRLLLSNTRKGSFEIYFSLKIEVDHSRIRNKNHFETSSGWNIVWWLLFHITFKHKERAKKHEHEHDQQEGAASEHGSRISKTKRRSADLSSESAIGLFPLYYSSFKNTTYKRGILAYFRSWELT